MKPHATLSPRPRRAHHEVRLSPRHEHWVVGVSALTLVSGVAWVVLHFLVARPDDFGIVRHPLEPWLLRLHGAAAMLALVMLGTLLRPHVLTAWRTHRHRLSGGVVAASALLLTLTGYGLYYAGSETLRPWISASHWLIGIAALPALIVHRHSGKRTRRAHPHRG